MAAAVPIIATVAKVASVALGIKSLIEGIKEGNFLQAVLGGVGAFAGLSGLGVLQPGAQVSQGLAANSSSGIANSMIPDAVAEAQGLAGGLTEATSSALQPAIAESAKALTSFDPSSQAGMLAAQDSAFSGGGLMPSTQTALASNANLAPTTAMDMMAAQDADMLSFSEKMAGASVTPQTADSLNYVNQASSASGSGGGVFGSLGKLGEGFSDFIKNNPEAVKIASSALSGWQKERMLKKMWEEQRAVADEERTRRSYIPDIPRYSHAGNGAFQQV